jgi:4-hydroxybenzoate polyprenyltransferase
MALVFIAVFVVLMGVIYHFLNEMGWQFALGALFGATVYQIGYYAKHGFWFGP